MRAILNVLSVIMFLSQVGLSQILAIDFGTHYIKSAIVNTGTGKSFTIVQNHKSDRKFVNSIGFYNEERFYEQESLTKRPKFPTNCFLFNKLLVDSSIDPTIPQKIKKDLFLSYIDSTLEDQLVAKFILKNFPQQSNEVTLVETIAMILKYSKLNAEKQFQTHVKDVILTVPNYWNLKMRAFIVQAAQIADLYVLSLISQNSGAAINYALNQRNANVTEKILFYNLGANSLQMTIAQFRQLPDEKSHKPVESIFILADYGKPYVGGLRFDKILLDFFKEKFEKKYSKQLTPRAQIKLLEEIVDIKQVLSANKQATLFVEGLMDGIDYKEKIKRKQFQSKSKNLLDDLVRPVRSFLLQNNFKPEDLTGVELIGGSVRIPKLQSLLEQVIGNASKVGTHINGDQSMVLGAAFYGANSSKKFKVKGINLYDGFNFQIRAVLKNLEQITDEDDPNYFYKNVTVFKKKDRFGTTKQLNFKCKQNIIIELYKQDQNGLQLIRRTKVDNIEKMNETEFKVSLTVVIDPIETVIIKKAEIKYKKEEITSYLEKVKKQLPKQYNAEKSEENEEHEQQEKQEQDKEASTQNQNEEEEKSENDKQDKQEKQEKGKKQKQKKKKKAKVQYETIEKNKTVTKTYQKQLHKEDTYSHEIVDHDRTQSSKNMLKDYEKIQHEKKSLLQSRNKLQTLLYDIRDKLDNKEFLVFVQDSQKKILAKLLQEKLLWQEESYSEKRDQYDKHLKQLNKPLDKIKKRIKEYNDRDSARDLAIEAIKKYEDLAANITKKKKWIKQKAVEEFLQSVESSKKQVNHLLSEMKSTSKNTSSVYGIIDFSKISDKVKDQYFKIMATPEPKKEKKSKDDEKENQKSDSSENKEEKQEANTQNEDL